MDLQIVQNLQQVLAVRNAVLLVAPSWRLKKTTKNDITYL